MKPEIFITWLQGYFELTDNQSGMFEWQVETIRKKLSQVEDEGPDVPKPAGAIKEDDMKFNLKPTDVPKPLHFPSVVILPEEEPSVLTGGNKIKPLSAEMQERIKNLLEIHLDNLPQTGGVIWPDCRCRRCSPIYGSICR
ncbi:MAG: hypothetical protein KAS32_00660 [Candidatus Peribacteraceae bacterium]|nr:hypothetical protein [Candidatus Peribacteraceae bacterium]